MPRRQLAGPRRLVDGGGIDEVGCERNLGEEIETARRSRSQDQALMDFRGRGGQLRCLEAVSYQLSAVSSRCR
jgi:hypothetical protein